jgi:hypothetical protein
MKINKLLFTFSIVTVENQPEAEACGQWFLMVELNSIICFNDKIKIGFNLPRQPNCLV